MITKESVKEFIANNPKLVSKKETSVPGIYVLKYKNRCFYDNIWNEHIENCRGVVIDEDYNLIANPFKKIFNYGIESGAPTISDDEIVTAVRKVNGFMLAVSMYKNKLLFSTTGSIDSEYVSMGSDIFYQTVTDDQIKLVENLAMCGGSTLLYEIVHPNDPHIIPEEVGAYFLGFRPNCWDTRIIPVHHYNKELYGKSIGDVERVRFGELKQRVKECKHEGFVIYCDDGRATKIKSPYYLIKKFFARCNKPEKLLERNVEKAYPEEYYPLIRHVQTNVDEFTLLSEQDRLSYIRTYLENYMNVQRV
jgi:hypothetical protein